LWKIQVFALRTIDKWFWHGYKNISWLMLLFIQTTNWEFECLWFLCLAEFAILAEYALDLVLEDVCLHKDDSLGLEDFLL
jgi:hypothetical protein